MVDAVTCTALPIVFIYKSHSNPKSMSNAKSVLFRAPGSSGL